MKSKCKTCIWSSPDVDVCHRRRCFYEVDPVVLRNRGYRARASAKRLALQSLQTLETDVDIPIF